jgi:hypothetical protein
MAKRGIGPTREADFAGRLYDAERTGKAAKVADVKLWWKMRDGDPEKPFISGACRDGDRWLRLVLFPQNRGSFPTPEIFKEMLTYAKHIEDPGEVTEPDPLAE